METRSSLVGRQIGVYTLRSLIGAGGMGEVYLAHDSKLGRDVAIKVLPEWLLADPDRRARFDREARLLAALNHPHIGAIYGIEDGHGALALVLELVEGPTLTERLRKGPLPFEEAVEIARQTAEALDAAHERGIVHRDLKPDNVKITSRGAVKLLDFGIATREAPRDGRTAATEARLTATGSVVGTVAYMSPEQLRGETVDARSDQFSLGVMLFEMLTGRHPFQRASPSELMVAILRDKAPALAELNPNLPPPLQWLVDRCLAKASADRYDSTRDLAKDLATLRDRLAYAHVVETKLGPSVLPVPRTPLVGRETELETARSLLLRDDVRLVTFTGAGGTGKTRLALQVAADLRSEFPAGVYFVPFGSITEHTLAAPTLAHALGTGQGANREPTEAVKTALAAVRQPILLVLDNLEQVLGVVPFLTELLEHCAQLKLLVTSRAVLRVYGEQSFEVPPLAAPPRGRASLQALENNPAIALFVQRAMAVKPDFRLTAENASAVAEICRKLDGLPLAIELAAARVRMLAPKAMLQRLESRFELLTGGARDLPARQQTLLATVEWSYGLLAGEQQKLFRRLAAFVGGCTLEAAEAVCNATGDLGASTLDEMEALVGQSLVQQSESPDGEARFTMLETIRDYAAQRLTASTDDAMARRAHAAYYLVLAEEGEDATAPEVRRAWLDRCELEHDNFRAALDWAIRTSAVEWGLRLGAALFPFWETREHLSEGRERLNGLLKLPETPKTMKARARVLLTAGMLATEQGDQLTARTLYDESLRINRTLGDAHGLIGVLNALAVTELLLRNLDQARTLFEECIGLSRETGHEPIAAQALANQSRVMREDGRLDEARSLGEQALAIFMRLQEYDSAAWLQNQLGDLERERGDAQAAGTWYQRALATFDRLGDRAGFARTRIDLASLLAEQGDRQQAHGILAEALTTFRDLGNRRGIARALDGYAAVAAGEGRAGRALRLAGAAGAVRHSVGAAVQIETASLARDIERARVVLGADAMAVEMEGWAMTTEAAAEYASSDDD